MYRYYDYNPFRIQLEPIGPINNVMHTNNVMHLFKVTCQSTIGNFDKYVVSKNRSISDFTKEYDLSDKDNYVVLKVEYISTVEILGHDN